MPPRSPVHVLTSSPFAMIFLWINASRRTEPSTARSCKAVEYYINLWSYVQFISNRFKRSERLVLKSTVQWSNPLFSHSHYKTSCKVNPSLSSHTSPPFWQWCDLTNKLAWLFWHKELTKQSHKGCSFFKTPLQRRSIPMPLPEGKNLCLPLDLRSCQSKGFNVNICILFRSNKNKFMKTSKSCSKMIQWYQVQNKETSLIHL